MIELDKVYLKYNMQPDYALKDISLRIPEGRCVLFCGKSGCGKSSLLKIINGMIPDYYDGEISGTIRIDDLNPQACSLYELSLKVGTVFQNPRTQFYTVNTTSEIAFGCENHGMKPEDIRRRIYEVAQELKLEDLLDKNIFNLSGGEKQKIALASIYAMNPDVYVLDEPSSNLDFKSMKEIADILKLLKEKGKTILIAEHRLWYIKYLVDDIYYLEDGEIKSAMNINQVAQMNENDRLRTGIRNVNLSGLKNDFRRVQVGSHQISFKDVSVKYNRQTTLKIKDETLHSGKIIAVIGDNGAGKTTFISSLCGYLKRQKGEVDLDHRRARKNTRISNSFMVMQDVNHQLFTNSVMEEVSLGAEELNEEQITSIMSDMDIIDLKERHPMTLSGGQKQRVASACAATCKKQIIVFDEPTSGLDYFHMSETSKLIKSLITPERFIFVITHDYEFILKACDSVIEIDNGGIREKYDLDENTLKDLDDYFNTAF